jgi:HD-GYP domain-containing protein (c-di-GMP phosphodiesterase class II)
MRADEIPLPSRIAQLAEFVEVAHRVGGTDAVRSLVSRRRGKQFDPQLAGVVDMYAEGLLDNIDGTSTWKAVIEAEPALGVSLAGERIDEALLAIANFVDLKSPYTLGHSGAVAELVGGAAAVLDFPRTRPGHCGAPRSCTTSDGSASRTRSGTSADRWVPANGSASGSGRT